MKKAFGGILLLLCSLSLAKPGVEDLNKIVGGTEVNPPFKYSFMGSLVQDNYVICGASLISPDWVLSAAHCIVGADPASFSVIFHRHDLRLPGDQEDQVFRTVTQIVVGKRYTEEEFKDDIALLKLSSPITNLAPVALDTAGTYYTDGREALIMGWGAIVYEGSSSPVLLDAKVPLWDLNQCNQVYGNLESTQLCAGRTQGGVDACQGDSGGPILVTVGNSLVQVGIVSYGTDCAAPGIPGVYTYVYAFRNFISEVTADGMVFNRCAGSPCGSSFCYESLNGYVCSGAEALGASLIFVLLSSLFVIFFSF